MSTNNSNDIAQRINEIINDANNSIDIAMAWLTDESITRNLLRRADHLQVRILTSSDPVNLYRFKEFKKLIDQGADIRKTGSTDPLKGDFMHAKMIISDNNRVFGGSYNLTKNSKLNFDNFGEYVNTDAQKNAARFRKLFQSSISFFKDFDNPEAILRQLEKNFKDQDKYRDLLLGSVRNLIDERNQLIQEEIKKKEIRSQLRSFQERKTGIDSEGAITEKGASKVKPHRFYGGLRHKHDPQKRPFAHSVAQAQKRLIQRRYKHLKAYVEDDTLVVTGSINLQGCEKHKFRVEYRAGSVPKVSITNLKITPKDDNHMYDDGTLCLYFPGDLRWKPSTDVASHIIPWIYEWVLCHELYKSTRMWEAEFVPHKVLNSRQAA